VIGQKIYVGIETPSVNDAHKYHATTLTSGDYFFFQTALSVSGLSTVQTTNFSAFDCGFLGPGGCTRMCKSNMCTGEGECVKNMICSCTGCNCFPDNDCGMVMGDRCGATCRANGCRGPNKKCVENFMCCCDGCGGGK
jgi:hypothetical protein